MVAVEISGEKFMDLRYILDVGTKELTGRPNGFDERW